MDTVSSRRMTTSDQTYPPHLSNTHRLNTVLHQLNRQRNQNESLIRVGRDGLEPPTSCSQSTRAAYCATARYDFVTIVPLSRTRRIVCDWKVPSSLTFPITNRLYHLGCYRSTNEKSKPKMSYYQLTTLDNGLRVITEEMPNLRSVSAGFWVATGSRDEQPGEGGASYFLEHLVFKGTEDISARVLSETAEKAGASLNTSTSRERTCSWSEMVDRGLPTVMGIMSEMLQRPAFRPENIDSARLAILHEFKKRDDNPQQPCSRSSNAHC